MSDNQKLYKSIDPKAIFVLVIILFIIGLAIIGIVRFNSPIPDIDATTSAQNIVLPGQFSVAFPDQAQSAIGTDTFGVIASSPDQNPVPIASVAKIMTAYLVLKAHPLQPGEDGPTLTMTDQDVAGYQSAIEKNYSRLPVTAGEELTERQLLEGLLLPSGNNIADTLGRWVAGSDEAFIAKMNDTAKSLGMTNTHYADASGANEATVSNAVDQIKIAQAAMQDPVFREIVAMPDATLPLAGKVYNVNWMLGKHGIVGIKTGSTTKAGGCFVSAAPVVNGSEKHYIIAAVLGSKKANRNLQSALEANARILDEVRPQFKSYTLTPPENGFGQITTPWHSQSDLQVSQPIQVFGYPGMKVSYFINPLAIKLPAAPGTDVATLTVQTGKTSQTVSMQNTEKINPPGFFWKIFR
ncbi:D-alanyl-D-alanine carboxypeptidase family protein [Phosphitispora sp. TUW77]|uniref:D-alanyl-D-alanine carboxypeptidase family protein n=1 Tax=Phosphitispora sp. TUW77 TaxID=3152361 RepID=UPI003AB79EC3